MIRRNIIGKFVLYPTISRSFREASTVTGSKMDPDHSIPLSTILTDFPKGPLTVHRKKASFEWRKMKLAIDGEDMIRYKNFVWDIILNDEVFHKSSVSLPLDEERYLAHKRMMGLHSYKLLAVEKIALNPRLTAAWCEALFMYDVSTGVKLGLTYGMFVNVIRGLGTSRHDKFIDAALNSEIAGCFALTEIAHGSNAKGMRTTATFDPETKEFILHSADFEAAKCWVGALGKSATHAVVYAKLRTPDGQDHGLHAFVVPIRCTRTLKPFAGVIVGDLGEKIALNGVDNGFVMFNSYHIPAENLLNKLGDVDEKGNYVSPIQDSSKRFGASLGILSGGRVQITGMATNQLQKAITIAIRYSAVRKQFGPDGSNDEFPVIEYQQQQFRLLPYLAATYAMRIFSNWFIEAQTKFVIDSFMNIKNGNGYLRGMEIHALSSAAKPIITWMARDGIQVCREACGGHGYLKATGIGDIRNENDANCTYEGENSILIQQTSNWLLGLWRNLQKGEKVNTPYNTADFLNNHKNLDKSTFKPKTAREIVEPTNLINSYRWLVYYTLKITAEKVERLLKDGKDNFSVRNDTQAYHAATLSAIFAEHAVVDIFYNFAMKVEDKNSREVLLKLVSLYGAWTLEKHLGSLYMGGYFSDNAGNLLREGILDLCVAVKPESVSLVDTIAPPDFILNSVLGNSDGHVYQNLQSSIFSYPGALTRPNWWKEVVHWETKVPSKL